MELDKTLTYYLTGPMSGVPQFNFPLFRSVTAELRSQWYLIVSPAEQDSAAIQKDALASKDGALDAAGKIGGETWGEILARDVKLVADKVDGLILLPGWGRSRGARLEVFVGLLCGKKFGYWASGVALPLSTHVVRFQLGENMP